jgi:hypothetical protein
VVGVMTIPSSGNRMRPGADVIKLFFPLLTIPTNKLKDLLLV